MTIIPIQRNFIVGLAGVFLLPALWAGASDAAPPGVLYQRLMREAALVLLKEGNARFVAGSAQHPEAGTERRTTTATGGQEPWATILACSDSRVPVELLFDRGIGDLFVVRVAGNVADVCEMATLEYGIEHLHTPLLVVLGHSRCGAVTAVVQGSRLHGHLERLADKIKPAARIGLQGAPSPEAAVPRAIEANVWHTIAEILRKSAVIREQVGEGVVRVEAALYDLESGEVRWLGPHPEQETIVREAEAVESKDPSRVVEGPAPAAPHGEVPQAAAPTDHGRPTVRKPPGVAAAPVFVPPGGTGSGTTAH